MLYEVVITNLLFFYFVESTYSIATVLSTFLLGLGVGSFLIYKLKKIKNKESLFGYLQLLLGLYALFILTNLPRIIPAIHPAGIFIVSSALLMIPTIILGASF